MVFKLVEDINLSKDIILKINDYLKKPMKIMEVCGTHTMSIYKYGIDKVMPKNIHLVSGPGCPVCVTEINYIDSAIALLDKGVVIVTFADMLKVPGSHSSLLKEKSKGKKIQVIYSPEELLTLAECNKGNEIVFIAVGFETIASGDSHNDLGMIKASKAGFLFRSTDEIKKEYPELPAFETYDELMDAIKKAL